MIFYGGVFLVRSRVAKVLLWSFSFVGHFFGLNLKLGIFCGPKLISWVLLRIKVNFLGACGLKLICFFGALAFVIVVAVFLIL